MDANTLHLLATSKSTARKKRYERGKLATKFTTNAVAKSSKRQVILYAWDKFGGRVLGDIILDGQSLRSMLIQNGFAREYYGEAKQSWCN